MVKPGVMEDRRARILQNLVSPCALAVVSYIFFLLACLLPPAVYTHYMLEPDFMFLDPATILFYTLCAGAFVLGAFFFAWLFPYTFQARTYLPPSSPLSFLLTPLLLSISIAVIADIYLLLSYPILLLALISQQSGVKETMDSDATGHFIFIPLQLIAVTWWAFWRYSQLSLDEWRNRIAQAALGIAAIVILVTSIVTLDRGQLMFSACGIVILHIIIQARRGQKGAKRIATAAIIAAIGVPLLFMAFSFLRGSSSWDDQVNSLLGYTVAAYNRMAAILGGRMRYPFGGRGAYLSSVIAHNGLLPFSRILNMPDAPTIWNSEFQAVTLAGLDGRMIWSGTFGYLFSDIGWFTPFFMFGYGVLYGYIWKLVQQRSVLGAVLYPWFGFCVLFWFGHNYLLETPIEIFVGAAILLSGYERLITRKQLVSRVDVIAGI